MKTPAITIWQAFWLFVNSRFIITLVFIPQLQELPHLQDILPALLLNVPLELLYGCVFVALWSAYPNHTLIEYTRFLFGRWTGSLVGLLFIGYLILNAAITVRVFDEFLASSFLIQTPIEVIELGILLLAGYAVYAGLEVLGRCADILVPMIFLGLLLIIGLALPQAEWGHVIPTWESSFTDLLIADFPGTTRWNEYVWMAMIIPFITNKRHLKRVFYGGIAFNRFFWLVLMVPIAAIFGKDVAVNIQFPTYELIRSISVGQFLERIDALALGLWVFGSFMKMSIFYYAAVLGASQLFGLKSNKTLTFPIGIIIFSSSLLLFSGVIELKSLGKTLPFFDMIFVFVIPLVMLLIHAAKKRMGVTMDGST